MTITFPLSLPSGHKSPARIKIIQHNIVGVSRSPFTQESNVDRHAGQWWEAQVSMPPMEREDAAEHLAVLSALNGQYGTLLLGDSACKTPRGTWSGSPVVYGASQSGGSLLITGLNPGATGKKCDYLQLGSGASARLHWLLNDFIAGSPGDVQLDIWPDLREAPSNGSAVVVNSAQGVFQLASNDLSWDIDTARFYGLDFACVEALRG